MSDNPLIAALEAANRASPFHQTTGFRIAAADEGDVRIMFAAAPALLNHAGALHAGVQCAALDTVAGYAAATIAGPVVTLQMSTQFLASARGDRFEAIGRVTRAGKEQLFVDAELIALRDDDRRLVARALAVLTRLSA